MDTRRSDVLFVPSSPRDGSDTAWVELRRLRDGRTALPVYTSREELVASRGDRQPWIGVTTAGMAEVQRATGYDVVLVNGDLSPLGPPQPYFGKVDDEPPFASRPFMVDPVGRSRRRSDDGASTQRERRNRR